MLVTSNPDVMARCATLTCLRVSRCLQPFGGRLCQIRSMFGRSVHIDCRPAGHVEAENGGTDRSTHPRGPEPQHQSPR